MAMIKKLQTSSRQLGLCWCIQAIVVVILASTNLSTATYHPGQHPQYSNWNPSQQQQEYSSQQYYPQQHHVQWETAARGGSTTVMSSSSSLLSHPPHEMYASTVDTDHEPYQPPKILLTHMSMALRVTSEWNRRLLHGVNRFKFWKRRADTTTFHAGTEDLGAAAGAAVMDPSTVVSTYGTLPVNVHPSRAWRPPIPTPLSKTEDDDLTLFHAKAPRRQEVSGEPPARGVARWGPDLLPYLEHVVDLLEISSSEQQGGVEIPLAMIYLDRACSVETPRTNGIPPCPFCTPRTVHRLSLVSLLLATQAVKGWSEAEMQAQIEKLASLGIPEVQLQQMVDWMRGALGDAGLMVTVTQMKEWGRNWESIFPSLSSKDQAPRLEQQSSFTSAPQPVQLDTQAPRYY